MIISGVIYFYGVDCRCFLVKAQRVPLAFAAAALELGAGKVAIVDDFPGSRHGPSDDRFRGLHVFLEEHGRDGQHIANVVKAVPGVIGRQLLFGLEIKPHQIADRVAILDAIEAADGNATGVGVLWVNTQSVALDPGCDALFFFRRWPPLFLRGHEAGSEIFQDGRPELRILQQVGFRL